MVAAVSSPETTAREEANTVIEGFWVVGMIPLFGGEGDASGVG